jgi:hypothetical protein
VCVCVCVCVYLPRRVEWIAQVFVHQVLPYNFTILLPTPETSGASKARKLPALVAMRYGKFNLTWLICFLYLLQLLAFAECDFSDANATRTSQSLASFPVLLALVGNYSVWSRGITFNRIRPVACLNMRTGGGGVWAEGQTDMITSIMENVYKTLVIFSHGSRARGGAGPPQYQDFTITPRHTTLCRTPLDEWSALRRDLYLTTLNTHMRQTSMPSGGIRTLNPTKRTAADPHLRPRCHW